MWSHAVTSGRQRVDKQGAVPNINNSILCLTNPGVVNNGIDATLLMLWPPVLGLIVLQDFIGHCLLCVYPLSTSHTCNRM